MAFSCLTLAGEDEESAADADGDEVMLVIVDDIVEDFEIVDELFCEELVLATEDVGDGMAVDSVKLASCLASD